VGFGQIGGAVRAGRPARLPVGLSVQRGPFRLAETIRLRLPCAVAEDRPDESQLREDQDPSPVGRPVVTRTGDWCRGGLVVDWPRH